MPENIPVDPMDQLAASLKSPEIRDHEGGRLFDELHEVLKINKDNTLSLVAVTIVEWKKRLRDLKGAFDEAHDMITTLTTPPLAIEQFMTFIELPPQFGGRVGIVSKNSGEPGMVAIHPDVDQDQLRMGKSVLTTSSGNCILAIVDEEMWEQPLLGSVGTIKSLLPDGRVIATDSCDKETLLYMSAGTEPLIEGDTVKWTPRSRIIGEKIQSPDKTKQWSGEEVSDTSVHAMGGLDKIRDSILKKFIYNLDKHSLAAKYGIDQANNNLMLAGPPGCGKTLLARIIASEIQKITKRNCRLRVIAGSELYNPYVGATEQNIVNLFRPPKNFDGITVVFLDEIDAIGMSRGNSTNVHSDRFLSTLLSTMEGYEHQDNVIIIGATNRRELLDPALLERFSTSITLDRPDKNAALEIFKVHLPDTLPMLDRDDIIADTVEFLYNVSDEYAVSYLILKSGEEYPVFSRDLMSGRLIEQISNQACERAFQREVETGKEGIVAEDFEFAVSNTVHRLSSTLSLNNVHMHLSDLPMDAPISSIREGNFNAK